LNCTDYNYSLEIGLLQAILWFKMKTFG